MKLKDRRVCKQHFCEIETRKMKNGNARIYCPIGKKFMFWNDTVLLDEQMFQILMKLNKMDKILGELWNIAFHSKEFPKLENGLPRHNLGDLFVTLHTSQRSICKWGSPTSIHERDQVQQALKMIGKGTYSWQKDPKHELIQNDSS